MLMNIFKILSSKKDEISNNKPPSVITTVNKICKIAKAITGESNMDQALLSIKKNKENKIKFTEALQVIDSRFYDDRINARARDLNLTSKFGMNRRANYMILFICISLCSTVLTIICFRNILTPEMLAILTGLIGVFSACLQEAFHFEFGGRFVNMRYQNKSCEEDVNEYGVVESDESCHIK